MGIMPFLFFFKISSSNWTSLWAILLHFVSTKMVLPSNWSSKRPLKYTRRRVVQLDWQHMAHVSTPSSRSGFESHSCDCWQMSPSIFCRGACPIEDRKILQIHPFSNWRSKACHDATGQQLQSGYSYILQTYVWVLAWIIGTVTSSLLV